MGGSREIKQTYEQSYDALQHAEHLIFKLPACYLKDCTTCAAVQPECPDCMPRCLPSSDAIVIYQTDFYLPGAQIWTAVEPSLLFHAGLWELTREVPDFPLEIPNFFKKNSEGKMSLLYFFILCSVHYGLKLDVWMQLHQGFSRHRNEAAQALQRKFAVKMIEFWWYGLIKEDMQRLAIQLLMIQLEKTTAVPLKGQPFF